MVMFQIENSFPIDDRIAASIKTRFGTEPGSDPVALGRCDLYTDFAEFN
jgi:hypothetical protein